MKILCLDLSTNTGWALFKDQNLTQYGNIRKKVEGDHESPDYPRNYTSMAAHIAYEIYKLYLKETPDIIVIEETNKGKNRYWQKQLEFIHFAVNAKLYFENVPNIVKYLDTSEWRKLLSLSLDKEDRVLNNEINSQRNEVKSSLEKTYDQSHSQEYSLACSLLKKRERTKAIKEYCLKRDIWVKSQMKSFRSKKDGKVIGKVGVKKLSVNYVNEKYNLKFKQKDNDIADAICLHDAYIKKISQQSPSE